MSKELARRTTDKLSGGNNNYWLVEVIDRAGNEVVVEAEDIIERFDMSFSLATVFKSIWRLCKLRQGLGKPGSSMLYEAEKIKYYSQRTLVLTLRHIGNAISRLLKTFFNLCLGRNVFAPVGDIIDIPHPKRLEPYSFNINDFVAAMKPTGFEKVILYNSLRLAQLRHHPRVQFKQQWDCAAELETYGAQLEQREVMAAKCANK